LVSVRSEGGSIERLFSGQPSRQNLARHSALGRSRVFRDRHSIPSVLVPREMGRPADRALCGRPASTHQKRANGYGHRGSAGGGPSPIRSVSLRPLHRKRTIRAVPIRCNERCAVYATTLPVSLEQDDGGGLRVPVTLAEAGHLPNMTQAPCRAPDDNLARRFPAGAAALTRGVERRVSPCFSRDLEHRDRKWIKAMQKWTIRRL
jgi:hypothetical protein